MMDRIAKASPRFKARMAGVFQLLEAVTAAVENVFEELDAPGEWFLELGKKNYVAPK
jgi:hypothetical protein